MAARAYPVEVRTDRGAELVGTLLDAGEDSRAAFIRQVVSVVGAGLAARSRAALAQPPAQIAICAVAWAGATDLLRSLTALLGVEIHSDWQLRFLEGAFLTWVLPILIVLLFTLKATRISGILGVTMFVWSLAESPLQPKGTVLVELVLPVAGFAAMALAPRRIPAAARWVWTTPAAVLAFLLATKIGYYSGVDIIAALVVALCFLPFQPAFAIGWTLAFSIPVIINLLTWPGAGYAGPFTIVLVSCTPLVVIAFGLGRLRVRRG